MTKEERGKTMLYAIMGVPKGTYPSSVIDELENVPTRWISANDHLIFKGEDIKESRKYNFYRLFIHVSDSKRIINSLRNMYGNDFIFVQICR